MQQQRSEGGVQNLTPKNANPLLDLSPREKEVLGLVALGMGNEEIGKRLFISPKTVKNYVTRIRRKLGLENRTQVALYALRKGLVDIDETNF
ncbi:MAG: response regulator transcription factor [Firmicutes bacterium]|nr:response regulator transcription factor [Bacillota bacterium]